MHIELIPDELILTNPLEAVVLELSDTLLHRLRT